MKRRWSSGWAMMFTSCRAPSATSKSRVRRTWSWRVFISSRSATANSMFENFSEEAKRCIFMARLAAITEKSKTIALPHLLAGIRKENTGIFRGVDWQKIPLKLARLSPENLKSASQMTGDVPLDAKAKKALLAAHEIAKKAGGEPVGAAQLAAGVLSVDAKLRKQMQKAGMVKERAEAKGSTREKGAAMAVSRSGIGYDLHRL